MNINWTKTSSFLRSATTVMLVLALVVSAAFAGQGRVVASLAPRTAPESPQADKQIVSAPTAPEQTGGKMAPDKKRGATTTTLIGTPVAPGANDLSRVSSEPSFECDRILPLESRPVLGRLPNSLSMISSALGRQYTLVGAKPDGTM